MDNSQVQLTASPEPGGDNDYAFMANAFVELSRLHRCRSVDDVTAALDEVLAHMIGCETYDILTRHGGSLSRVHGSEARTGRHDAAIAAAVAARAIRYGDPVAIVPLVSKSGDEVVGVVVIEHMLAHKPALSARDRSLLEVLREHGGIALETASVWAAVAPSERSGGYLAVRAGASTLALALGYVVEVFQMVAVETRIPGAVASCVGMIAYRDELLPVFDAGACLGLHAARDEASLVDSYVVVVMDARSRFGWIVDELKGLHEPGDTEELTVGPEAGGLTTAVRLAQGEVIPLIRQVRQMMDAQAGVALTTLLPALRDRSGVNGPLGSP